MLVSTATGLPVDDIAEEVGFALALGCFDGVHLGHAALFSALRSEAEGKGLTCAAWTFAPPKGGSVCPVKGRPLIISYAEKLAVLHGLGIEYAFVYEFGDICGLSPESFVFDILIKDCRCAFAVCGYDFTFGARASGNADTLAQLLASKGIGCKKVSEVTAGGAPVCSEDIRSALSRGDMREVERMLGREYSVSSAVVGGKHLGRVMGFPTVNQYFFEGAALPRFGVYASCAKIGNRLYPSVTNVGVRPTVSEADSRVNCETHIIGFSGDLYGVAVRVSLKHFIRPERKFPTKEELIKAVKADILTAEKYYGENIKKGADV